MHYVRKLLMLLRNERQVNEGMTYGRWMLLLLCGLCSPALACSTEGHTNGATVRYRHKD